MTSLASTSCLLFFAGLLAGCAGASQGARKTSPRGELASTDAAPDAPAPAAPLVPLPPERDRAHVPGFDGATAWLNVDHPLRLEELRGRAVLVDFWTSCCVNCMQTLPKLAELERRFAGRPFVVVGVHSPKFDAEQDPARLRDALGELGVEHPIAVDANMAIWRAWGVSGWPTLAVLDTKGHAVWAGSGEPNTDELASVVETVLDEARRAGELAKGALPGLRREKDGSGALRYPGKVATLPDGGLAIADTGHDRVILRGADGSIEVVGSGAIGARDGAYADASFHRPRGMTAIGDDVFVADTENHLVRRIDRKSRRVTTIAGTGELGARPLGDDPRPARDVALRSPWDVLATKDALFVALAGSHQVARIDRGDGTIRRFVGTGEEARIDGDASRAAFAQPSALATDGARLFVLDSETSSVRAIDLASGRVRTVVGRDLFVFGDVDGDAKSARLQHPIGLAFGGGALWVADTYNAKVKRVDPVTGETRSIYGGRDRRALDEPAGIAFADGALVVADTNHHRVVRVGLDGRSSEPLALAGLAAPSVVVTAAVRPVHIDPADPVTSLGTLRVAPGEARVRVDFRVPSGTAVNDKAFVRMTWVEADGLARVPSPAKARGAELATGFDLAVETKPGATRAMLAGVLDLVVCDAKTHAVCLPVRRTVRAELVVDAAASPARAAIDLPAAKAP
jgi:thiol-disulfide isomerase/thioredoxin